MPRTRDINYNRLVKPDTFIGRYLELCSSQETATIYDFWCAAWVLSSVIGRKVIVDRPRAPVYLNWYIILVAESGVTRKSSAVKQARNLLSKVADPKTILTTGMSAQALEWNMHKECIQSGSATVRLAVSELVTALGKNASASSLTGLLTDLYDCPELRYSAGTTSRGEVKYEKVFCSFLSASTPSWLLRSVDASVVEGGFTSRTMFVVSEQPKGRIVWPTDDDDTSTLQWLEDELRQIDDTAKIVDRVQVSPKGISALNAWYKRRELHRDAYRASFESREDAHVLRMAACLAINDRSWTINTTHVKNAIRVIEQVKRAGSNLFVHGHDTQRMVIGISKLRETLISNKDNGIMQSHLFRCARPELNGEECSYIMEVMHELKLIKIYKQAAQGKGKTATIYLATDALFKANCVADVVDIVKPQ